MNAIARLLTKQKNNKLEKDTLKEGEKEKEEEKKKLSEREGIKYSNRHNTELITFLQVK